MPSALTQAARVAVCFAGSGLFCAGLFAAARASAESAAPPANGATQTAEPFRPGEARPYLPRHAAPTPINVHYLQYGVGLGTETVLDPGHVCPSDATTPCIYGSGGGIGIHVGYRTRGPWYFGGAYEVSRHDSANLLRLAIVQQGRADVRRYLDVGRRLSPYAAAGVGGIVFGNEFGAATGGLSAALGGGGEYQLSRTNVVGAALMYRPVLLHAWTDATGTRRADAFLGFGLAHMVSIELVLELRQPLSRW
jgi:hypothetical protein